MRMEMNKFFAKLRRNDEGVSIIEFGLIAPVTVLMMLGTIDLGHSFFVKATLDGAIQNVARLSSMENAATPAAQALVDPPSERSCAHFGSDRGNYVNASLFQDVQRGKYANRRNGDRKSRKSKQAMRSR